MPNFGTRSILFGSSAERRSPPGGDPAGGLGRPGEAEGVIRTEHRVAEDLDAGSLVRPEEAHVFAPVVALLVAGVEALERVGDHEHDAAGQPWRAAAA
jgi:hypothetical protein